jgi:putative membrane protein
VAQHLLFGAFAPLALVLAAPVTLTLRALGPRARRPLVRLLRARWLRVPTHPATAAVLDVGALYLVHLTPLYRVAHGDPAAHLALHAHYLAAGALFAWSIAGPDPAPGRPGLRTRAAVLVAAVAAHATLAKLLYAHPPAALGEPAAVRAAAQLMYYGGDVAELLLAVALFAGWYRARRPRPAGSRHPAGPAVRRPAFRGI